MFHLKKHFPSNPANKIPPYSTLNAFGIDDDDDDVNGTLLFHSIKDKYGYLSIFPVFQLQHLHTQK